MLREFEDDGFISIRLLAVLFSIDLRRNLTESKQRKKATDYSVAFFPDSQPLTGLTILAGRQHTLFFH
ncbi:hypothetical protein FEK42_17535 [Escherichia sp. E2748]|nr:hypothetical protein D9742_13480 [Escherichia sp. E1V33]RZM96467.1 hypothetical protein D9740_08100 [Escherichia sp. E14V5]RZN05902.1 hypothetical protein D9741_03695 [Escherichia sp. E14V7]RZN17638.1 hypothetical protein D9734_20065 [Escherichia sp. E14S1]RZN24641.1 hypothetical protein D9739_18970 [Escherichia sp. E14V10]RZN41389.1 hypothetical protein D9738_09615 [Escherichia sp. E10V5]RZN47357.1 hypothetical protein D9597_14640 [Escherichia sp. E13S3]RZN48606.1 hypothetical protein D9